MNILLCHPQKDSLEMIRFCLESQGDLVVHSAAHFHEALEFFLDETLIDLVITSQHGETEKLFKFMLSTNSQIPVIFLNESRGKSLEIYPDIRVLGELFFDQIAENLVPLIKEHFNEIMGASTNHEFCRINTSLLIRVVPLRGDLFIRLSSLKFVKLFRAGRTFSKEDLEKYLTRKKVSFLYVKKNECQEFVEKFKEDLLSQLVHSNGEDPALQDTVIATQELIQELSSRLGFNSEVRQLAKINMDLTMKMIGASPKLNKILNASALSKKNFISSHSVLLANISCSISAQMKWPSDTTFQKLVMASLFHDFAFQNSEHAKISTLKQLEERRSELSADEYQFIKNHPIKCSDTIKQLNEVPSDVDTIVIQHHERPDGSGFPRGLSSHQIAPLSAVFIVAHDILDCLTQEKNNFDLQAFLTKNEALYQGQAFRKIWTALSNGNPKKQSSDDGENSAA